MQSVFDVLTPQASMASRTSGRRHSAPVRVAEALKMTERDLTAMLERFGGRNEISYFLLCSSPLSACGIDGPPPAGQVEGSPSTDEFTPEDY